MEAFSELVGRFPLLERVHIVSLADTAGGEIPAYVAVLLAVAEAPNSKPLGFILPRKGNLGRIVAVMHSLQQLDRKLPEAIEDHITRTFPAGTKVRLKPDRFVYRLEWVELHPRVRVRISQLNKSTSAIVQEFDTPAALLRLEPTHLNGPRGTLSNFRANPNIHPLDLILATPTFGNRSLMHNEVLLLDTQGAFQDFASITCFQPPNYAGGFPPIGQMIPFGSLTDGTSTEPAHLRNWDDTSFDIEPLVAVTSSIEKLADFCTNKPKDSKLVIINDVSLIKNLQSFDAITASQRVLLFLDADEHEYMEALGKRKCRFWRLNAHELQGGLAAGPVFGPIARWATNYVSLEMEAESCADLGLDAVCAALEGLRGMIAAEPESTGAGIARRAWGLLSEAARFVQPPTPEEQSAFGAQISRIRRDIAFNPAAISPDAISAFEAAFDGMAALIRSDTTFGAEKGKALYKVLKPLVGPDGAHCAMLARSPTQAANLERWAVRSGLRIPVLSLRTLPEDASYAALVCPSWPGADFIRKATARLIAPRIVIVCYPFEKRWVNQCKPRLKQRPRLPTVSRDEIASLLKVSGNSDAFWEQEELEVKSPQTESLSGTAGQSDIWAFERSLRNVRKGGSSLLSDGITGEGLYVSFVGESYAYLTETFRLPAVNDVVAGVARVGQKLKELRARELKPGDFVVFPASGDTEIIHQIADRLIGPEALNMRRVAHVWKDALRVSRMSPAVFLSLSLTLGLKRDPVTIRNWFADESQIGPRDRDAVELVAKITDYEPLVNNIEKVWRAMETLRGKSISAGSVLRDVLLKKLPLVLDRLEEQGSEIEIDDLGSAWVVQVDFVSDEPETRARGELNRLWWDTGYKTEEERL